MNAKHQRIGLSAFVTLVGLALLAGTGALADETPTIEGVSFQNVGSPPTHSVVQVTVSNSSQLAMVATVEVEADALDGTQVWGTSATVGLAAGQTRVISVTLGRGIIEVCLTRFADPTGLPQE